MEQILNINQSLNAGNINNLDELEQHFNKAANMLLNNAILHIDGSKYRLTEIEFYFYKQAFHEDPYIHRHQLQLLAGTWYFHGSGLDITFGDGVNYGGILIRGMQCLNSDESKFINGPLNVVTEIFKCLGKISVKDHVILLEETNTLPGQEVVRSTRVGLKRNHDAGFSNKYYRYITFVFDKDNNYAEKTKVAHAMLDKRMQNKEYSAEFINENFRWAIIKN